AALTLTCQILEGDRPPGGGAVPRQVEEEPLAGVVVFVVARVVRVQDPVDPVLGAGGRRPGRLAVRALRVFADARVCRRSRKHRAAGYKRADGDKRDQKNGSEQEATPLLASCRAQDSCCHYMNLLRRFAMT